MTKPIIGQGTKWEEEKAACELFRRAKMLYFPSSTNTVLDKYLAWRRQLLELGQAFSDLHKLHNDARSRSLIHPMQ